MRQYPISQCTKLLPSSGLIIKNLLTAVVVVLLFTACGSAKHGASPVTDEYSRSESPSNIRVPHAEWTNLYTSANINIDAPMALGCSGRLTMEKGRYIHLSMRFIGMEVAVVYIDNEKVYFVDKYHKYIFAEPLSDLLGERYKGLSLSDIQDMVLGTAEIPDNGMARIEPSGYVGCSVGLVASRLSLNADLPQGKFSGSMSWNPVSATWNDKDRKVDFKAPDNYTRITLESLMQAFGNM